MRAPRRTIGALLVLHGIAHILPGMRVTTSLHWWIPGDSAPAALVRWLLAVSFWGVATLGLTGAGLGLLGVRFYGAHWRRLLMAGAACSLVLLGLAWRAPLALPGIGLDLLLLAWAWRVGHSTATIELPGGRGRHRVAAFMATAFSVFLALLILAYPWHMRWGSSEAELRSSLPGDESMARPTYLIQHSVTINAPPSAVWPWLVQLGGDRAGFYSYSKLENLFGLGIRNADRIHPEWQRLGAGDSVFATPRGWLGIDHRLGWRVSRVEPERVLVLDLWGAFVLEPAGSGRTRLIVRTRGAEPDRMLGLLLAPAGFLVFEPAHFIMERKMLLEIKRRAEQCRKTVLPPVEFC
jgi:hypothetical protein